MPFPHKPDVRFSKAKSIAYLVWAIIGTGIIVAACVYALGQVSAAVEVILFASFLVFVLRVPVAWMQARGMSRAAASAFAYLAALILVVVIVLLFIPVLSEQIIGFSNMLPGYIKSITEFFSGLYDQYYELIQNDTIQQVMLAISGELSRWATQFASSTANGLLSFGTTLANAFIVVLASIVVGFWVLKDLPRISHEMLTIVGSRYRDDASFIVHAFARSFGGYLKGMVVAGLCTGTMAGICYYFIGLPYPLVLGLLTGLMNFIPILGTWIAAIIIAFLGLSISPLTALLAIAGTIVPQMITDNFISPRVMAGRVELHPSIILVMLIVGSALGGVLGMLCAIPLTAALKSIFVYYFERRTKRTIVSPDGAFFKAASSTPVPPLPVSHLLPKRKRKTDKNEKR